ncbi:FecR protein [Syntrophus gentianae]|uniref:FecR protein n=1 Tax=Syntrophus gentianae TaxID=43775 RepID=A0A1H7VT96_9BACT|nr:FecR family protein [Syntrophus gentianae]SEM12045.1 FecR protein [Syntrophus gentianae]
MTSSGSLGVPRLKRRDRPHFVLSLQILCIFLFTFFVPAAAPAEITAVGIAKKATGTLVVVRADGVKERFKGKGALALFEGDDLRTDKRGGALIELDTGIQAGLNRNTSLKIVSRWEKEKGTIRILRLKQGMLWVKTTGGLKQLEVETPVAIAVVKGTEFVIEILKNGNCTLKVIEGLVEFGTAFGTCPIRTSTVSYAVKGKKCTKAVIADVKRAANWTAELRGAERTVAEQAASLPTFWPPPDASTHQKIPRELLASDKTRTYTWANVAARLEKALADNGYSSPGYYAVPEGFALISQLERINQDATPASPEVRWKIKVDPVSIKQFNLDAYLKALLGADAGLFRVIAFVFTPVPIVTRGKANIEEAKLWVGKGGSTLPQVLAKQVYGEDMEATALIYEFEVPRHAKTARLNKPSQRNGQQHLKAAKILKALGG